MPIEFSNETEEEEKNEKNIYDEQPYLKQTDGRY